MTSTCDPSPLRTAALGPAAVDAILLDSYAARSCPVKTQNAFDSTLQVPPQPSEGLPELFAGGDRFRAEVLDEWVRQCPGLVDLREPDDGHEERAHPAKRLARSMEAMARGAPVILGPMLPVDSEGHRMGRPDALVRGTDGPDGRPCYHPGVVKFHQIADRHRPRPDEATPRVLAYTTLDRPAPMQRAVLPGYALRLGRREGDFLQLAHYSRMLQATGYAGSEALGAVVGTDRLLAQPVLAWADLHEPVARTFSRTAPDGWRLRSLLERYDHEHAFRVEVAAVARQQTGRRDLDPARLVAPIRVPECARCPWWEHCRPQLDPDDVSLRIDTAPLDRREIAALRERGVRTVTDLAGIDVDDLLPSYLPRVSHRAGAEGRVRVAARRARMLVAGRNLARETAGPIAVPSAQVEVDFDIETSAAGRIYLWGFLVRDVETPAGRYCHFSRFADLDPVGEVALAEEALGWLRRLVAGPRSVAVYHYSGYEVAMLTDLARRHPSPTLDWAAEYSSEHFVDLLEIVKAHFFGVAGLGLKRVAAEAGFAWRDADPGGLNSQRWFVDAVHADTADSRNAAVRRVLEYNEDDVIATREVRRWLRAQ